MNTDHVTADRDRLTRLLSPRSVAIVGASERQSRSNNAFEGLKDADVRLFLVNPNRAEAYGQRTYPDLLAIGEPVDAVLSLVNADLVLGVIEDAAATGAGGVVVPAAGFAEAGAHGLELQTTLAARARAARMPIVGPNCTGFINARVGVRVSQSPVSPVRGGGIGLVSHSGAFFRALFSAAAERGLGYSFLISTGNEAVTDMVDYVEFLIDDQATRVICLVIETLRRPDAFLRAVARARSVGKPVIALKLGRSDRARKIAVSHTGSLVSESAHHQLALQQAGVVLAADIDDLLDRASLFEQLPADRWTPVGGVAALTLSGGAAALISDVNEEPSLGLHFPALEDLAPWLREALPGVNTPNPLDLTGFILSRPDLFTEILSRYVARPEVDAVLLSWGLDDEDEAFGRPIIEPFVAMAKNSRKPMIIASPDASRVADWAVELRTAGIAVCSGVRPTLRALASLREFVTRPSPAESGPRLPPLPRPTITTVAVSGGSILPIATALEILRAGGVPTAPYVVLPADDLSGAEIPFPGPYAVKLADVPHRTELGAVRLDIDRADIPRVREDLRSIARAHGAPETVIVQPLVTGSGEALIGVQASDLGPVVLFGLGGVQVELLRKVSARIAPFSSADALEMLDELRLPQLFLGFRGQKPWDRELLARTLVAVGDLALRSSDWTLSLDINPLVNGPQGFQAVDVAWFVRDR